VPQWNYKISIEKKVTTPVPKEHRPDALVLAELVDVVKASESFIKLWFLTDEAAWEYVDSVESGHLQLGEN
jgi:hypothetical protein